MTHVSTLALLEPCYHKKSGRVGLFYRSRKNTLALMFSITRVHCNAHAGVEENPILSSTNLREKAFPVTIAIATKRRSRQLSLAFWCQCEGPLMCAAPRALSSCAIWCPLRDHTHLRTQHLRFVLEPGYGVKSVQRGANIVWKQQYYIILTILNITILLSIMLGRWSIP